MKDDTTVGCGIWPVILKRSIFIDACAWHDETYLKASFHQKKLSRKFVDQWFLQQMKKMANTPLRKAQAYVFYGIALLFGGIFWEGKR